MKSIVLPRFLRVLGGSSLLSAAFLVGCGPATTKTTVTGTVTHKGEPVNSGRIKFFSSKTNLEITSTFIQKGGTFAAADIPFEEVKVAVDNVSISTMPGIKAAPPPPGTPVLPGSETGPVVEIPAKYKDPNTSNLVFTISPKNQKLEIKVD